MSGSPREFVLKYDFESGPPPGMSRGQVVPGPPRPGSSFCALGTVNPYALNLPWVVAIDATAGLFTWSSDTMVSFDYWLGVGGEVIEVQYWNIDRDQNYELHLPRVTTGGWAHVDVRLSDTLGAVDRSRPQEDGDRVRSLEIIGGPSLTAPIYVDNVRIWRVPSSVGSTSR